MRVTIKRRIDSGAPIIFDKSEVFSGRTADAFVDMYMCDNPECPGNKITLSVQTATVTAEGKETMGKFSAVLDLSDGSLVHDERPHGEPIPDWIASKLPDALETFRARRDRIRGQLNREQWRSLPREKLETMMGSGFLESHCEVFPYDWDMVTEVDGHYYWLDDTYCMNPDCPCRDIAFHVVDLGRGEGGHKQVGTITVELGDWKRPTFEGDTHLSRIWEKFILPTGSRREVRRRFHEMKRASKAMKKSLVVEKPINATGVRKPGRNTPCPCGSGRKYKRCCGQSERD